MLFSRSTAAKGEGTGEGWIGKWMDGLVEMYETVSSSALPYIHIFFFFMSTLYLYNCLIVVYKLFFIREKLHISVGR